MIIYLPLIASKDYEAFRDLLGSHIPDSFDGWLKQRSQWRDFYTAQGDTIRDIDADPNKFARHLAATGHAANLNELLRFLREANT